MSSQPNVKTDDTLLSRVECKYLVRQDQVDGIREFIQPFVHRDRFARGHADGRYTISSLYLDSPEMALYRSTTRGIKNRFKLRIRTYTDKPEDPTFFEVKKRMNGIVYKFRQSVARAEAMDLLERNTLETEQGTDLSKFISLRDLHGAEPVMRVKYKREAFVSQSADPVRITFDNELEGSVTVDAELRHEGGDWITVPMDHVILELKFTNLYPSWVGRMVNEFQLERTSVPKYVLCVDEASRLGAMRMVI